MGVIISHIQGCYQFRQGGEIPEQSRQVFHLADKTLSLVLSQNGQQTYSHLVVTTTCPDMLAPSLGQMLNEKFNSVLSKCHTIDIVQGCAGGVSALILASQLAELNKSNVLIVQADAAQKATSRSKPINKIFGNGSFSATLSYSDCDKGLLHYKSTQYAGLSEVVTVNLGHDSDFFIKNKKDIALDPRKHLGLSMNNSLALKLLHQAERFYLDFVQESTNPEVMILHQVNPTIISHLQSVFKKYPVEFIDVSETTGNCGAASIGVALNMVKDAIMGKKILMCSFGTGGVITAGLWQT